MWTSNQRKIWTFLGIILVIGFLVGVFYITFLPKSDQALIASSFSKFLQNIANLKINFLANHLFLIPILIISSFLIIGALICLIYLFYLGFLMGFVMSNFIVALGFKGFLFGLIYLLITRFIFLFFLSILIISIIKIAFLIINLILKKNGNSKELIFKELKRVLICFIFIMLNDTILYFLGDNIVKIFQFLVI